MSTSPRSSAGPAAVSLLLGLAPLLLGPLAVSGCGGGVSSYSGTKTSDYFNAESIVRSTYSNDDQTNVPDNLLLTQPVPAETVDGRLINTIEQHMEDDNDTFLGGVKWSSASGGDTLIHGWEDASGTWVEYDPPVSVTDSSGYMHVGASVVTETGGVTFTSTFIGEEDCPVLWTQDTWENCLHLNIDDGGGPTSAADAASRPIFVGDYWLVTRFFVAWMQTSGWDEKWVLSDYDEASDTQDDRGGLALILAFHGLLLLPTLSACAEPDYRAADLQLDVDAALPVGAERIHVCVDGVGILDQGAGNGRVAFAAIPPTGDYTVTVEVYDADQASLGVVGPLTVGDSAPYVLAPLDASAPGGCVAPGRGVHEGEDSWLLGIRFDESATPWDLD